MKSVWVNEWKYFKRNKELFFLSVPGLMLKFVFSYLPLIFLVIAFKNYRFDLGVWGSEWAGLKNFKFFFVSESAFTTTRNTIGYNLAFIVSTTMIALALAIMLNEVSKKWVKVHQTVLFLPYFLSWVVVGYIALAFLDHKEGLLNSMTMNFGMDPVKWYQEAQLWPFIIVMIHLWKSVGFATLIYYAGILSIDPSYYEAARIDGASKWHMVTKITIPSLSNLVIILFIVDMGKIFRSDFGLFYFVPNNVGFLYTTTDVIDTYVFRSLRVVGDLGMSTAVGLYQSAVGLILVVAANYMIKKINRDQAMW